MSDEKADGPQEDGQHGALRGKDGSAHDFFWARLDALVKEEDRLLTESISLGNTKSDVARKKVDPPG